MTLRAADVRFVLPHSVATATVIDEGADGALVATADALRAAGVLCGRRAEPVDLVVAQAREAERALKVPARSYVLVGRADPRVVRRSGRAASQLLILGGSARPATLVPSASADALAYYLTTMTAPVAHGRRLRNRTAVALVRAGLPVRRFVGSPRVATVLVSTATVAPLPTWCRRPAEPVHR